MAETTVSSVEFPQCLCLILTWNILIYSCHFLEITAFIEHDIFPLRTKIHVAYPIQFKKVRELCTEQRRILKIEFTQLMTSYC